MNGWKRLLLPAACAALLLGLLAPAFGAAGNVYLMAVNDTVVETTAENMPRMVGGVLYVPYTMLSNQVNGFSLGVSALYSTTRRTVLVTDNQRGVIFDLQNNTAEDINGAPVAARAMMRNTMVFLPIDWLCQYFGSITCTRTRTPYGTLIRITNSAAILGDQEFANAADSQLADNLRRYLEAGGPDDGTAPLPSGAAEASDAPSGAELFLALRSGPSAADCARLIEGQGGRALFLFTQEELAQNSGLARRIAGAGHTIGLALTGTDLERCLAEAERGRELLASAVRYNALVVSAPGLDGAGRGALEEKGYVVWSATVRGEEAASGSTLVQSLNTRRINYVELACDAGSPAFLTSALRTMEEENCRIYQATAPALS